MTKLMWILGIVLVVWGGYAVFEYWSNYDTEKDVEAQKKEQEAHFTPSDIPGMPYTLESTYTIAEKNGATGIRNWLKAYGAKIQDPRRGWIELDYVVAVATEDPSEAKKVYADVKSREIKNEHLQKRLKDLAHTYE